MKSVFITTLLGAASLVSARPGNWGGSYTTSAAAWESGYPASSACPPYSTVTTTVTVTATPSYTSAKGPVETPGSTINVTVGANKKLLFDPPFLQGVKAGQKIHFDFRAANHTLTSSSFAKPCTIADHPAVDTNFQNFNPNDVPDFAPFDFIVPSEEPQYFYCKQANRTPNSHCGKGMVFAINVDQSTYSHFVANAEIDGFQTA